MSTMNVVVPKLDIDDILYRETNGRPHARGVRERRIVANLIAHLQERGFNPVEVFDGDEFEPTPDIKSAMEIIFNLDEASLQMIKSGVGYTQHGIYLVLGNDMDIICDWNYSEGDRDGFNAAMNEFDVEKYA